MSKRIPFSTTGLLLVIAAFILYECSLMFAGVEDMGSELSGVGASSVFSVILLLITLVYLGLYKSHNMPKVFRSYAILFTLTYFLTVFFALIYPLNSRIILVSSVLPLCFWYLGDNCCTHWRDVVVKFFIPLCFVLLSAYFLLRFDMTLMLNKEYAAINASYVIIYLLPFVLLSGKRVVRLSAIIIAIIVTLMSLKRGGMVSLGMGIVLYIFTYGKVTSGRIISFWGIFVAAVALVAIVYLIVYYNEAMNGLVFNRFASLEQDEGSGRISIFNNVERMIAESSPVGFLIGHGWAGVARDSGVGLSAHNDFLEIIYDFGIIAFVVYIVFLIRVIKCFLRGLKRNHAYSPAFAASIGIFITNSFVSHIYIYPWYMLIFTWFWAFVIRETYSITTQ